ncbi:MAG: ATP-dependent Clp protease ATP-binding subunit [Niabella sp.]|nr:MAG: ATP-dependent Clp protease ATP-binding subunit [Niabella sp.]
MPTLCTKCNKKPAIHQTQVNLNGRLFYMSLCDDCLAEYQDLSERTENLNQFSKDLITYAKAGKLDPVIGRETEVERVINILCRRTKNNPVLIGEPGVGKTAIVEGLAQKIVSGEVPEPLRGKRLVSLDLAAMISGAVHRGAFEKRLKDVIDEVSAAKGQIILFLDEVHTLVGAGSAQGSIDAANILKPYLSRGELQLIGATTIKEYRIIEKDAALERRFQPIMVDEPTPEHTIQILDGLKSRYEDHHKIKISDQSIIDAVKFSSRYIADRFLPDKAIDLIDEAGAALRLEVSSKTPENLKEVIAQIEDVEKAMKKETNSDKIQDLTDKMNSLLKVKDELSELWLQEKFDDRPILESMHIAKIVSKTTGIPVNELSQDEKFKLKNLGDELNKKVVGQKDAVEVVSKAVIRARTGIKDRKRPIGVFMFLGPTGVGKTQLAKSLAEVLYGSEDHMIRVDMGEYNERHNVARLIGSPPGYVGYEEGGQLTEKVRKRPFSIILFDEIEKAHGEIFNSLLQVLDDGVMTDGHGVKVNFKNTIIIMTSNVGSDFLNRDRIGFGSLADGENSSLAENNEADQRIADRVNEALKHQFKPEFLNRIDDIVIFKSLNKEAIKLIVDNLMAVLESQLIESGLKIKLTAKTKSYLVENGYNPEYGARPLRRLIQKEIEDRVSSMIVDDLVKPGDTLEFDLNGKNLEVKVKQPSKVAVQI